MANPIGRPPIPFDEELTDYICERFSTSDLGLEQVLQERLDMGLSSVSTVTIYKWLRDYPEFAKKSARARHMQAELLHDRAQQAANTPLVGEILTETVDYEGKKETSRKTCDNVQRSQLIVQTLLRRAGQLDPKRYGEKVQVDSVNDPLADLLTEMREEYKGLVKKDESAETA